MPADIKPSAQRRTHVTTACTNCRHNKLKCDGQKPRCGSCTNKGHECVYQLGKDKRQFSLRKVTAAYSKRVLQLEQFIESLGAEVPAADQSDASVFNQISNSILGPPQPRSSIDLPVVAEETQNVQDSVTTASQVDDKSFQHGFQPNFFAAPDVAPPNVGSLDQPPDASPASGLSYEAYDFMMPGSAFQLGMDMDPPDWVWSMPPTMPFMQMQPIDDVGSLEPENQFTSAGDFQSWVPPARQVDHAPQEVQEPTYYGGSSSEDEHDDEIIEQLSTRLGDLLIGDMGELRYYGPTSNLTLTKGGMPREHRPSVTIRPKEVVEKLKQEDIGHEVDSNLVDQLVDLFFTWQDPSCHIVDKVIFQEEQDVCKGSDQESPFYSAALENVICALGALIYSDKQSDLPRPLSKFFAQRAKILVEYELDSPKVATVQTFALLSWHAATCTKDSRGWLYAGAASRISLDLGLHIDTTARVEDGSIKKRVAYARSVAFWGSFLTDRMWGFYLGRPFNLHTSEISLPLPSPKEHDEMQRVWTPSGMFDGKDNAEKPPILDCSRDMLAFQWVTLCQIVSSITIPLYSPEAVSKDDLVDLSVDAFKRIRAWKKNLPSQLQHDVSDKASKVTPHVLVLHMQYYLFVIIQHRPFISKGGIQPYPPRGDGPLHARRMCLESAIEIARLLEDYATRFALRLANTQIVHMAFSAALILLYASVSETDRHRHETLAGHLATCCDALAELGNVFENATRSLDTLLIIKRTWKARLVSGVGHKRRSTHSSESTARTLRKKFRDGM